MRGWDLLEFWRGEITARKTWVRIRNLPPSSAFQRAFDPDGTRWGESEHLLARLIDITYAVNGSKTRVYRPGSPEERAAIADAKRVQAIRDRHIAKHRKAKTRGGRQ